MTYELDFPSIALCIEQLNLNKGFHQVHHLNQFVYNCTTTKHFLFSFYLRIWIFATAKFQGLKNATGCC